jgi:hypothetical protein
MDFPKQEDVLCHPGEVHWDLVIVDEAHKMAAYRYGDKTKTRPSAINWASSSPGTHHTFSSSPPPLTGETRRTSASSWTSWSRASLPTPEMLAESIESQDNPLFLRRLKEDLTDFDRQPDLPAPSGPHRQIQAKRR